ncbi:FdxN element excision controlling factor protein like [Tolypothrix tenuis PCC 7101]|uniref:FdxN element excision controlling factor protein like n=1 Tax=Tolypothrix tenuis PCC 7101 TaxID=231146 RepID=A0A1Z4N561_9CYAN|nr:FdxN element excision controlling factor protein like [Tolypothrix tenuis PCC 7101]BAZ75262.1 FdxN element excision controlling factor protein like [Aulosira laxa NIES-50]
MDSLKAQYKDIIEKVLKEYADFLGSDEEVEVELVFDQQRVGAASP